MTQEEKWLARYEEVVTFIETNHRDPSKHRIEEHDMLNWLKANRKALNAGKMKPERVEKFGKLLGKRPEVGKLYAEMNLDCAIRIGKVWRFRKIIVYLHPKL